MGKIFVSRLCPPFFISSINRLLRPPATCTMGHCAPTSQILSRIAFVLVLTGVSVLIVETSVFALPSVRLALSTAPLPGGELLLSGAALGNRLRRCQALREPAAAEPPTSSKQRVLVAIAADTVRSASRLNNLWQVIDAYQTFPEPFEVTVMVDTLSPVLVSEINARYGRDANATAGKGCGRVQGQLWQVEDLLRIRQTLQNPNNEPLEFLLTHAHRSYFARLRFEYDLFIYGEDDVLLDFDAFLHFRKLQSPLWSCCSYLPGFYRFESMNNQSAEKRYLIDNSVVVTDPLILVLEDDTNASRGGRTLLVGFVYYFALWILDASQLHEFIAEPGGYYSSGPTDFGLRERMAFGFNLGRTRTGLQNRALIPLDPITRTLDRRFGVHHLSGNYVNGPRQGWPSVEEIVIWNGDLENHFLPITPHASHPCP